MAKGPRQGQRPARATRLGLLASGLLVGCASLIGSDEGSAPESPAPAPAEGAQAPDQAEAAAGGQEQEASDGPAISGRLSTRLRHRRTGDELDTDLDAVLSVDVGQPTDDWSAHVLGRANRDFGGDPAFRSLDDTYDGSTAGRLHDAWVDLNRVGPLSRVRLGRQTKYDMPFVVTFDGVEAQLAEHGDWRWTGGAYAGQTVHGYESSPDQDAVYGLWAQSRPWRGGRARLDLVNLRDDTEAGKFRNDWISLDFWQIVDERLRLHGEWTQLDGDTRDMTLDATWYDAPSDTLVQVTQKQFRRTQRRQVLETDPFFVVLRDYAPYDETRVLVSKGFDDDATVELGHDDRSLRDDADEAAFNREFQRWYVTGTLHDVTMEGISLSLTGETWDGDGDDVETWGVDVTREHDENTRISVGSYYALYKNDFLLDQEREHVRTYYLRLRRRTSDTTSWMLAYEREVADLNVHMLTGRVSWRF